MTVIKYPQEKQPFAKYLADLQRAYDDNILNNFICIYDRKYREGEDHEHPYDGPAKAAEPQHVLEEDRSGQGRTLAPRPRLRRLLPGLRQRQLVAGGLISICRDHQK